MSLANTYEIDVDFFQDLFSSHYEDLVRYAQRFLFDRGESEDLVQETFLYLWENRGKVQIHSTYSGYLYSAVKNRCYNYLKARGHNSVHPFGVGKGP